MNIKALSITPPPPTQKPYSKHTPSYAWNEILKRNILISIYTLDLSVQGVGGGGGGIVGCTSTTREIDLPWSHYLRLHKWELDLDM